MATMLGSLLVSLGLESGQFKSGMSDAQKEMVKTERKFMKIGSRMQSIGAKMSLGLTAPIAAIGAAAVRMGADFEKSMSNISTLVDTNVESMEAMKNSVLEISKRTPVAISDLTSALYDVRSAGISASDAMQVLERSAQLGVAGLGSTAESVDLVTSSINAFGLEGEEASKVYDNIFRTVQAGKTTISQLSQGFGSVAPVVAQANIELDEYLASVGAMTSVGLPAAQAQTQIRAAIAGLSRETKETSAVFETLGAKNFKDLVDKSGGMVAAFQRIVEATGGSEAKIIKLVGSVEAFNAIMSLSGQTNETFTNTLAGMRDGTDAVGEAFEKQAGTSAAKWQEAQNSLQASAIKIGTALAPVVSQLAEMLAGLAGWFSSLSPASQKFVIALAGITAAAGPVLLVLGNIVSIIPALLKLGPVFSAIRVAALALMTNPVILGFAAVIGAIYLAWKNWDKIAAIVQKLYNGVKTWLQDKLGAVLRWVGKKVENLALPFKALYTAVVGNSYIPDMVDGIGAHMKRLDKLMVEQAENATAKTAQKFMELRALLDRLFPESARLLQFKAERQLIADSDLSDELKAAADAKLARDFFKPTKLNVGDRILGHDRLDGETVAVSEGLRELPRLIDYAAERMEDFKRLGSAAFGKLGDELKGVVMGFQSLGDAVKNLASRLADLAFDFAFNSLGRGLSIPGFANGTNFAPGGLALVGERGPEIVNLPRGSSVYTNEQSVGMMGGVKMTIVTPNADSFRRSDRQIARRWRRKAV
ncbi:phage tail tape measure protein [Sphingomicrobium sp. XHP0239]|uniref:phage tail tape measure protein n=1 Tax=Sphingomicrobium maritimum TaxID=3133972 RepID=UPI0031CC3E3B